jgi:hypothetical protein
VQEIISFSYSKVKVIGGFVVWTLLVLLFAFVTIAGLIWGGFLVAIFSGLFFALLFLAWLDQYKFLRKCMQGLPALQLTPRALVDNMNSVSFVWKDIRQFTEGRVNVGKGARKPYIAICLYKEADYLPLVHGWKNKLMAQLNCRFFGGALSIETNAIKESRQEVINALNNFKDRFST